MSLSKWRNYRCSKMVLPSPEDIWEAGIRARIIAPLDPACDPPKVIATPESGLPSSQGVEFKYLGECCHPAAATGHGSPPAPPALLDSSPA